MGGVVRAARGWLKRWAPLGLVMAALILPMGFSATMAAPANVPQDSVAPSAQKAAEDVPTPAWITLDGRKVLEVRVAAGAQTPQFVAERGSRILEELAKNPRLDPDQLVVKEDPPYFMVGVQGSDGRFQPQLAVDERAARAFALSREELALLYRDQMRGALKQYRSTHSLEAWLTGLALALAVLLRGRARFRGSDLLETLRACGPDALPVVGLLTGLLGMTFAFLGATQLKMFGAQIFVADLVAIGTVREMAPLICGLILAGRTGAAYAAHIGAMQANEEIDALRTLGIAPVEFLVVPRLLALVAMIPLLCLYGDFCGIAGGLGVGVWGLDLSFPEYWQETRAALRARDIGIGVAKSACYGVLVALCGCFYGLMSGRSASAVGRATTRAVVSGIVLIILADAVWAVLLDVAGL